MLPGALQALEQLLTMFQKTSMNIVLEQEETRVNAGYPIVMRRQRMNRTRRPVFARSLASLEHAGG
jgi:hypothetical protein